MTLPGGWRSAHISEVADLKLGKMLDQIKNKGELRPYLRNINVRWGNFDLSDLAQMRVTSEEAEQLAVCDGDLFICEGGEPGRAAVWRGGTSDLVFQKALHRVRPHALIHPDFIAAYLGFSARQGLLADFLTGTTIKHLPQDALSRISLPLAPANEQRRIVAKLERLTVRISHARGELARSHKLAARLKRGALATADNGDRTGRIAPWLAAPIRNGLSVKGSDMPPGIRALRLSALRADVVDLDVVRHLPISVARAEPFLLKADDILVSRGNGTLALVGRASRVPSSPTTTSTIFPDTAFRLRFDPAQVDVTWLLHVWNSPLVRQQIEARARTTAGIWKISQVDLNEITLPKLSLSEQRDAALRISAILARADRLEAEAARAAALLDRLEASILAKAFRGQLVPQHPADEPASTLLDRIRAERVAAPKVKRGRHAAASSL